MTTVFIIIWAVLIICALIAIINAGKIIFKTNKPIDPFLDLMEHYESCKWLCWAFMFLTISWMMVMVI